jgi:hypothetical protein
VLILFDKVFCTVVTWINADPKHWSRGCDILKGVGQDNIKRMEQHRKGRKKDSIEKCFGSALTL